MEIPNNVIETILTGMADSYLEEEIPPVQVYDKPPEKIPKEKTIRRFKKNPIMLGTSTVLFSREGKYRAVVKYFLNDFDDGHFYRVEQTGRCFTSHKLAINHARNWLKKKRTKYYINNPRKRGRTQRIKPKAEKVLVKQINKLYKMELQCAKIMVRMSEKKLKLHKDYARKKFNDKTTTAVSGGTSDFNTAIYNVMRDGTKHERKIVSKMLKEFTHEPFRKTNMFY